MRPHKEMHVKTTAIYQEYEIISAASCRPGDLLKCKAGLYPGAEVELIGIPRHGVQTVKTRSGHQVEVREDDLTVNQGGK